jgi:hypothetical protein
MQNMLKKFAPQQQLVGSIAGACGVCFTVWLVQMGTATKPSTLTSSWKAQTAEYGKFQKLNPMTGYGSK